MQKRALSNKTPPVSLGRDAPMCSSRKLRGADVAPDTTLGVGTAQTSTVVSGCGSLYTFMICCVSQEL